MGAAAVGRGLQCTMEREVALHFLRRFFEKRGVDILGKRGEQSSPKGITESLVRWARKKEHLSEVVLIFSIDKWCDIGNCMWESVINAGKEEKLLRTLDPLWRSIINSLKAMQAERRVAAAAMQVLAGTTNLASEFDMLVQGITHPACSSAGQVKASVEAAAPDLSNDTVTESSAVLQHVKGAKKRMKPW